MCGYKIFIPQSFAILRWRSPMTPAFGQVLSPCLHFGKPDHHLILKLIRLQVEEDSQDTSRVNIDRSYLKGPSPSQISEPLCFYHRGTRSVCTVTKMSTRYLTFNIIIQRSWFKSCCLKFEARKQELYRRDLRLKMTKSFLCPRSGSEWLSYSQSNHRGWQPSLSNFDWWKMDFLSTLSFLSCWGAF